MKAILSKEYRILEFYDKVIASGVECIAEIVRINDDLDTIVLGLKYNGSKQDKTVLQIIKIIDVTIHKPVVLYLDAPRKLYNEIKLQQPALTIKKVNIFNRFKPFFLMKSDYVLQYVKCKYGKNEFYTDNILADIWDAYYDIKEDDELDELESLL